MHRSLTLTLLGSLALTACISNQTPRELQPSPPEKPVAEVGAADSSSSTETEQAPELETEQAPELAPEPAIEPIDERAEIQRWQGCHPIEVAHIEFGNDEDRATSRASKAELERLVAGWNAPPGEDGPVAKILIEGWRSAGEDASLDDLRAEGIRTALIEAGADSSLLLAAGFDVAGNLDERDDSQSRAVTVLEVCGICCIL